MRKNLIPLAILAVAIPVSAARAETPNLVGTWKGTSERVNAKGEYSERDKVIAIVDQKGRRFHGVARDARGAEKFIGVIRSDDTTFYWVDAEDVGQVQGRILDADRIETCYLESGKHAIAACSILSRER
jgi:hypothetical protein